MIKIGKKNKTLKDRERKTEARPFKNYLDECLGTDYHCMEKAKIFSEDIISMIVTCTTADEVNYAFDCIRKFCQGIKVN